MKKLGKFNLGIILVLFLAFGISVKAAGYQLNISLGKEGGQVTLSLYKVAEATEDGYVWLEDYQTFGTELSSLKKAKETQAAAKELQALILEEKISPDKTKTTDADGNTAFSIEAGAYLMLKDSSEGEMSPVLVVVPLDYEGSSFDITPKYSKESGKDAADKEGAAAADTPAGIAQNGKGAGTGDFMNVLLWIIAVVAAFFAVLLVHRKTRKEE